MKKIVFYGDSNTCGYDGESPSGSGKRIPGELSWVGRIRHALNGEWTVYEEGRVGRCIPTLPYEWRELDDIVSSYKDIDCFAVMLGTNDLLSLPRPAPEKVGKRMSGLLEHLKGSPGGAFKVKPLVIAPPYMDFRGDRFYEPYSTTNGSLSEALRAAAKEAGACFLDAGIWNAPCCSDRIHLSEEGHRVFSENFLREFSRMKYTA